MRKNTSNGNVSDEISHLFISAAVGTVLGASVALLFAPKSGRRLRSEIFEKYEDLAEKGEEFANDVLRKGKKAAKRAANYVDSINEGSHSFSFGSENFTNKNLGILVGAIGGGLLGATAAHFFSTGEDEEESYYEKFREAGKSAAKNFKNSSFQWLDTAKEIVESFADKYNEKAHQHFEDAEETFHRGSSKIHDALEWATLGYNVFQKLSGRR